MEYIVHKRFRAKTMSGDVNIPALSVCEEKNGIIYYNNKAICTTISKNAHQYFATNNDGNGMLRGKLTQSIQKTLDKNKEKWNKVWEDPICQKYKRIEHADHWLWNHDFFNADLNDLEYISKLVGAKI